MFRDFLEPRCLLALWLQITNSRPVKRLSRRAVTSRRSERAEACRGCNTLQQSRNPRLDPSELCAFNSRCSGAPVALIGQKGSRCVGPLWRHSNSGAAPATVGGEAFSDVCHWALRSKVWEGGEGRRPASQETCLNEVILPTRGARVGAGFRCGDRTSGHADGGRHG